MLRKFIGKSSASFFIKVTGIGIAFGTQIYLARIMGVSDYGTYVYVMTLINILSLFSRLGLDTAVIRFIPEYLSKGAWELFNGIRRKSLILTIQSSLCLFAISWLGYSAANHFYKMPEWGESFLVGLFLLPLITINIMRGAILQSLEKVVASSFLDAILRPSLLLFFVFIFYYLVRSDITPEDAILFNIESGLIVLLLGMILVRKSVANITQEKVYEYRTKEWLSVSSSLFLIAAINTIQNYSDIIMIEYFIDTKSVGFYSIANQISGFVGFGLISANMVIAPMISKLYHSKQYNQLQILITFSTRIIFVFTLLSSLFIVLLGDKILTLFGAQFIEGLGAMKILIVGQLVNAFTGSVGFIMTMTGHQKQASRVLILSVVINVILNLVLIPTFGIEGAAIATSVSMSIWNIIMFIYVLKKIGFSSSIVNFSKEFTCEN